SLIGVTGGDIGLRRRTASGSGASVSCRCCASAGSGATSASPIATAPATAAERFTNARLSIVWPASAELDERAGRYWRPGAWLIVIYEADSHSRHGRGRGGRGVRTPPATYAHSRPQHGRQHSRRARP